MTLRAAALLVIAVFVVVGGGAATWALFLRGDDIAPLTLPSAAPRASADGGGGASPPAGSPDASATSSASTAAPASSATSSAGPDGGAGLVGTWTIGADSVVGYRVRERLANLSADSDAVGRTNAVTGTATIATSGDGPAVTAAEFTVDMTTITSDRGMRDNRLRNDGIETDRFPTSTFTLTTPVAIPAAAIGGAQVDVILHGDLSLHGVTKTVDIPAAAQLNGGVVQVLGSLDFPFADFAINPPNIAGFVSVEDHGTLEFQVNLTKS